MSCIEFLSPKSLKPHPRNRELYGDDLQLDEAFLDDVATHGVLDALRVTSDGYIVSGHRRHGGALAADLAEIPCVRESYTHDDPQAILRLVSSNRQRVKSNLFICREIWAIRDALKSPCLNSGTVEKSNTRSSAVIEDRIKEHCGWKRAKIEEAIAVMGFVQECEESGEPHLSVVVRELLENQSVHAAYQKVREIRKGDDGSNSAGQEEDGDFDGMQSGLLDDRRDSTHPGPASPVGDRGMSVADGNGTDSPCGDETGRECGSRHVDVPHDAAPQSWQSDPDRRKLYLAVRQATGSLVRALSAVADLDDEFAPSHREYEAALEAGYSDWANETKVPPVGQ